MKIIVVIPAYNEEKIIKNNLARLHLFMEKNFAVLDWMIVVADNNSTDRTKEFVMEAAQAKNRISYLFVAKKGKGVAIKTAWSNNNADAYCFMDADLATDLSALPPLVEAIIKGHYDLACGSRFARGSKVARSPLRKVISHGYRLVLKILLNLKVKDAPCGFKAISPRLRQEVLPQVVNTEWFFDSELVVLAEKLGYRVKEIPVMWREPIETGRSSQVKIFSLSMNYFKKALEIRRRLKEITAKK